MAPLVAQVVRQHDQDEFVVAGFEAERVRPVEAVGFKQQHTAGVFRRWPHVQASDSGQHDTVHAVDSHDEDAVRGPALEREARSLTGAGPRSEASRGSQLRGARLRRAVVPSGL
jgi:hypothetical protein